MSGLKMSVDDINKYMKFDCNNFWFNLNNTNCYAFALGLDIPEKRIIKHAYQPGTIGANVFSISSEKFNRLTFEEKIEIDFKALNISAVQCQPTECSLFYYENDMIIFQWIIALFYGSGCGFHFMRKNSSGYWWHKRGYYLEYPIDFDDNNCKIKDPRDCLINDYEYIKCLKLIYKEKR